MSSSDHADNVPPSGSEDLEALQNLPIFGTLTKETIGFLLSRCQRVSVPAGQPFFEQQEMGDAVFVLRKGRVAVERTLDDQCLVLAELSPGDCFGEMALIGCMPRTATVRAVEDCEALELEYGALLELSRRELEQFTLIQMNLAREVARRLAAADRALFEQARILGATTDAASLRQRAAATIK